MINRVSIKTKSNKEHVMGVETYARWLCLVEAMEFINQKAKISKIDLEKNDNWIKPLALQKYIKQRYPSMFHDFRIEEYLV